MIVFVCAVAALAGVARLLVWGRTFPCSLQVTEQVVNRHNALPVTGPTAVLLHAGNVVSTTSTDSGARYIFTGVPIGIYAVRITARGHSSTLTSDPALTSGSALTLNASLELATTSQSGVREIGKNSASSLSNFAPPRRLRATTLSLPCLQT
jgi:hypothetical protein